MNRFKNDGGSPWLNSFLSALVLAALFAATMAAVQTLDQVAARAVASRHTDQRMAAYSVDHASAAASTPAELPPSARW